MTRRLRSIQFNKLSASQKASRHFIKRPSGPFILLSLQFLLKTEHLSAYTVNRYLNMKREWWWWSPKNGNKLKLNQIKIRKPVKVMRNRTHNWGTVLAGQRRLQAGPSRTGSPGRRLAAAALRLQSSARPAWWPPASETVHTAPDLTDEHNISKSWMIAWRGKPNLIYTTSNRLISGAYRECVCDGCRGSIFSQDSSTALCMTMLVCWLPTFPQTEILNSYSFKWIDVKLDIHGLLHGKWLFLLCPVCAF